MIYSYKFPCTIELFGDTLLIEPLKLQEGDCSYGGRGKTGANTSNTTAL